MGDGSQVSSRRSVQIAAAVTLVLLVALSCVGVVAIGSRFLTWR